MCICAQANNGENISSDLSFIEKAKRKSIETIYKRIENVTDCQLVYPYIIIVGVCYNEDVIFVVSSKKFV